MGWTELMKQSVARLSTNMSDSNRRVALLYRKTLKSIPTIIKVRVIHSLADFTPLSLPPGPPGCSGWAEPVVS